MCLADELMRVHEKMKELDVWRMETKAKAILQGLGFSAEMQNTVWKMLLCVLMRFGVF